MPMARNLPRVLRVSTSLPVHSLRALPTDNAQAVRETLREMRSIIQVWKISPLVRTLAMQITAGCANKDWVCEVRSLQEWVKANIRFVGDVAEVETLQTPDVTLALAAGDCDDQSILLGSLLQAIGHPVRLKAIDVDGRGFSHVYVETQVGPGWAAAETTEDWPLGAAPLRVVRYMLQRV